MASSEAAAPEGSETEASEADANGTVMPMDSRCFSSPMSRTRPEAARSAFDGTQPRFTHVPPTSPPESTAQLRPWDRACSAAPWPPTPQPTMTTS